MGFFSRLKNQIKYQQALELVSIEACEKNIKLQPKTFKSVICEIIHFKKDSNHFDIPLSSIYRDEAYIAMVSMFKTLFDKAVSERNTKIEMEIYEYLDTVLSIAENQILKLSDGTKIMAKETKNEIAKDHLDTIWRHINN